MNHSAPVGAMTLRQVRWAAKPATFLKSSLIAISVSAAAWFSNLATAGPMGPLTVHPQNPRYFADGNGKAVYLTGSHTWSNLQEDWSSYFPVTFDFNGYLDFLESKNHNFIRLWRREMPKYIYSGFPGYVLTWPHPWKRTGPGTAGDGEPKFNLNQFDPAFFNRLRDRCIAAKNRGIYISIMLFEGHDLQFVQQGWFSHPFKLSNNVNNINGDPNNDGSGIETHTLQIAAVLNLQKAYIRKVIDTVNDLDNVMYEIGNECHQGSLDWQRHLIDYIHEYQATKPQQHPVLLTTPFPNAGAGAIWNSNAQAVSPGHADGDYANNPPAANGSKVVISDTDHIYGCGGDQDWVWRSFMRGLNSIYMDSWYNGTPYCFNPNNGIRNAMGYANTLAQQANMAKMLPRNNHASSGYCLADLGKRYFVFVPGGGSVNLNLGDATGSLNVKWINASNGQVTSASNIDGGSSQNFSPPFGGSAVLHVYKTGTTSTGTPATPQPGDQYGRTILNAGDVTGNERDDRLVSAPYTKISGVQRGRVYVETYSTSVQQFIVHRILNGENSGDRFGWATAALGDIDGDGHEDFAIGAPGNDQAGFNAGKVYIYSGADGDVIATILGNKPGERLGYAISAGLRAGNGATRFVIGAPYNNVGGSKRGAAYVYSISSNGNVQLVKTLRGSKAGDRFGDAVAAIGRINSDTFDDFVIGSPFNDDKAANAGRIDVFSGSNFARLYARKGKRAGARFGLSLAGVGRSDGDSFDDFVVGSPHYKAGPRKKAGRITLYSGKTGTVLWSKNGQNAGDLFGSSLSGAGDVQGDGRDDVMVGAPNCDPNGSNSGRSYVYAGASGAVIDVFDGEAANDRFGSAVASLGDVTGDSYTEVSIGARLRNNTGPQSGEVYLISTPQ